MDAIGDVRPRGACLYRSIWGAAVEPRSNGIVPSALQNARTCQNRHARPFEPSLIQEVLCGARVGIKEHRTEQVYCPLL